MNPKTIKALLETKAGQELAKYIGETILSLDTISGIPIDNPDVALLEMRSRQIAGDKLKEIFQGLIVSQDSNKIKDKRDSFAVDVED